MRILLIEDNLSLSQLVQKNLEDDGHQVQVAPSGLAGQKLLEQNEYELVLMDAILPDGIGEHIGKDLRRGGASMPILLFSGKDALKDTDRRHPLPAESFLAPLREMIKQELEPHLRSGNNRNLTKVVADIRRTMGRVGQTEPEEPLEIFRAAATVGKKRLERTHLEITTSGLIAGMNVTFGAVATAAVSGALYPLLGAAASAVIGSLFFPIGFIFLAVGKSELFTENFLIPITAVLAGKSRARSLPRFWGLALLGNLLGALLISFLLTRSPDLLSPGATQHLITLAWSKINNSFGTNVLSGIFGGWLITLLTWLILASRGTTAKIAVVWCVGFLISLNSFNHVVVNSTEIFFAINHGEAINYGTWFLRFFLPTTIGNMIGGIFFVTMFQYLQVLKVEQIIRKPERYLDDRAREVASNQDTL